MDSLLGRLDFSSIKMAADLLDVLRLSLYELDVECDGFSWAKN
jgi:hypothetical protein